MICSGRDRSDAIHVASVVASLGEDFLHADASQFRHPYGYRQRHTGVRKGSLLRLESTASSQIITATSAKSRAAFPPLPSPTLARSCRTLVSTGHNNEQTGQSGTHSSLPPRRHHTSPTNHLIGIVCHRSTN